MPGHARSEAITGQDYDWSKDVAAIAAPALIIIGVADSVRLDHAMAMLGLLGGGLPNSRLAVLSGTTHLDMLARTDLLLPIVTSFLDAPAP